MKTLYLLRHAKSSWDDTSLPDRERPLEPLASAMRRRWGGAGRNGTRSLT